MCTRRNNLVVGANPGLPADLLSGDPTDLVRLSDQLTTRDRGSGWSRSTFARKQEVRQEAKRLLFSLVARREACCRQSRGSTP